MRICNTRKQTTYICTQRFSMHTEQISKKNFRCSFLHTSAVAMVMQHIAPVKVPDWWRPREQRGERKYDIG